MRTLLRIVVAFHFVVVFLNVLAFFALPIGALFIDLPWWYMILLIVPIQSLIVYLSFDRNPCPLTRLENHLRKKLNMKPIGGFIGYYLIKQKWRKPKFMTPEEVIKLYGDNQKGQEVGSGGCEVGGEVASS